MLMAMSWPALEQMFLGRRLSDAGTLLRNSLREARRQAMSDAMTYRVDFSPGTSRCRIVPGDDPFQEDISESEASAPEDSKEGFEPMRQAIELPDGVHVIDEKDFKEGPQREGEGENESQTDSWTGAKESSQEETTSTEWVPMVAFYPDGSATLSTIRLVMNKERVLELKVDPSTGEVAIGEADLWRSEQEKKEEEEAESLGLTPTSDSAEVGR
jgi:Tfp pilus assembly protein FimT